MILKVASGQPPRWQPTGLVTTLLSPGARQVIRCWLGSESYQDEQHHPRMVLALSDEPGAFPALVRLANPSLVSAVVLSELLRKGIVETLESGHVLLRRSAYAPTNELTQENAPTEAFPSVSERTPRRRSNDT